MRTPWGGLGGPHNWSGEAATGTPCRCGLRTAEVARPGGRRSPSPHLAILARALAALGLRPARAIAAVGRRGRAGLGWDSWQEGARRERRAQVAPQARMQSVGATQQRPGPHHQRTPSPRLQRLARRPPLRRAPFRPGAGSPLRVAVKETQKREPGITPFHPRNGAALTPVTSTLCVASSAQVLTFMAVGDLPVGLGTQR